MSLRIPLLLAVAIGGFCLASEFSGLRGQFVVHVGLPDPWCLSQLLLDGRAVDLPLDAERVSSGVLEIAVTSRSSSVSGQLLQRRELAADRQMVIVFSEDPRQWYCGSPYVAVVSPEPGGRFEVRSLPPGDYLVAGVSEADPEELRDVAVLESLVSRAVRIDLRGGVVRHLNLEVRGR